MRNEMNIKHLEKNSFVTGEHRESRYNTLKMAKKYSGILSILSNSTSATNIKFIMCFWGKKYCR